MLQILSLLIQLTSFSSAETLQIVTSNFTPFQVQNGEQVEGITTDIIKGVIKNAGLTAKIRMYPWPRAYKIAQREPNVIIYSIIKTPEREKLFKWIGVIAPYDVYFWKLAVRSDIHVTNLNQARKYMAGGVFEDVKADFLIKNGFEIRKNIEFVGDDTLNIKKLFAGRIDLLAYDEWSLPYKAKEAGQDYKKLKKLFKIDGISNNLYMAASLKTSDEVVLKLSHALEAFKKTKEYRDIKSRIK